MEGRVQEHSCECGWSRRWHDSSQYLDRVVPHPYYGPITGRELVRRDIDAHRCADWYEWVNIRRPAMLAKQRERLLRKAGNNEAAKVVVQGEAGKTSGTSTRNVVAAKRLPERSDEAYAS